MSKKRNLSAKQTISAVVDITNDLERFTLVGVVFFRGLRGLSMPGVESPDGWKWVDFVYEVAEPASDRFSEVMCELRLLHRRAYAKFTYSYVGFGVCCVRVYLLNEEVASCGTISWFRERFCRYKQKQSVIDRKCLHIVRKLYTVMDFSRESVEISSPAAFRNYLRDNRVVLFDLWKSKDDAPIVFDEENKEEYDFHINRFINGKCFERYPLGNHSNGATLKSRVLKVYTKFKSPSVDRSQLSYDHLEMNTAIMNGEVPGFKSVLYNYQRRSVAKMLEKELIPSNQLMPFIIKTKQGKYVNLKSMLPIVEPLTFAAPRGGILAENMGLGKTCICLALICVTKFQISERPGGFPRRASANSTLVDTCAEFINQNSIPWKQYYEYFPRHLAQKLESKLGYFEEIKMNSGQYFTRRSIESATSKRPRRMYLTSATLVVIPDNLFHQWNLEVAKHVQRNQLKILELATVKTPVPELRDLLTHDAVFISMTAFSRLSQDSDCVLRRVYWKRLIIDEGHSMSSKTTQAVHFARELKFERMWAISGTPTSGMTNLHVDDADQEYTVTKNFDAKQDLIKLGSIIGNFLKIEPWYSKPKLWSESVIKPMEQNQFGIDLQLEELLDTIIVRHTINDVESDIKLPQLHHKPVFLKPSFFDQLSINLFVGVLATNAVTSERKDVDYMFHPSNKSDLRRLITNLRKATFYWTGFSINDVQNLLNICMFALNKKGQEYTPMDVKLLKQSIFAAKLALSNMRWRSSTTIHEMGYFIEGLPKIISSSYSLVHYDRGIDVYGFPQIISVQKLFYKNRLVKTSEELAEKAESGAKEFWKGYWQTITTSKKDARPVSNKEEYSGFNTKDVEIIGEIPTWANQFDPSREEELLYGGHERKRKIKEIGNEQTKRLKTLDGMQCPSLGMRDAQIVGTSSSKLTYLTLKLLENQKRGLKSIVFYEFENSAYYLTEFMDIVGMNYIMYSTYIKPSERSKNLAQFDAWDSLGENGVCLVMDLKLASHGLTIIAATHVYFINPVWDKTVEAQAIKRSHRIGQTREVHVETIILKDTIEEQMYRRRGEETEEQKDVELIDHVQMKEYILKFPFLRMFDESFDGEYAPMEYASKEGEEVAILETEEDEVQLRRVSSEYAAGVRHWRIPMFSEMNMSALAHDKSKFKGDFDMARNLEVVQDTPTSVGEKRVELLKKLREDKARRVRFA